MKAQIVRSVVLPVAGPIDATWPELREALKASWVEATRCANWMMTELYCHDIKRTADLAKLPKMPKIYLYPEARVQFPALASQTVASLEREVARKYQALRYKLLWTQEISLPIMRYPVPLPLPAQMWRLRCEDGGAWIFSARIGDRRWDLRLRSGHAFRHQYVLLEQALNADGDEEGVGTAALYRRVSHESDHRNGPSVTTRLLVRLPVSLMTSEPAKRDRVEMKIGTGKVALLNASLPDGSTWREHNDQMRRAILAHEHQLQHLNDDFQAERRRPKRERQGITNRMGELARRHHSRMQSWLHEAAAHMIQYAMRQRVTEICYDDSDRSFSAKFPWYQLKARLAEKCEAAGIEFASVGTVEESAPPLKGKNSQ